MITLVGIKFRHSGKISDYLSTGIELRRGDKCIVETCDGATQWGEIVIGPMKFPQWESESPLRKVLRKATKEDEEIIAHLEQLEKHAFKFCEAKIKEKDLPMDLLDVEFHLDQSKAIFYFRANKRVDFRELVKELAQEFKTRIEMRQIGARDEAKLWGGIGPCGRNLCCNTFLRQFQPVSINMAKQQKLTLDPAKISGQCGRLMCCLAFELEIGNKYKSKEKNTS
jgi:cell fate regulator YaaT (PSP1 superfamily)